MTAFSLFGVLVTVLVCLFYGARNADANGYTYPIVSYNQRICSKECHKWTPKHCWDGYLKRKVWKMVCEKYDMKCCAGYKGPNCEEECFSCDKMEDIDRRIIDLYGKINTVNNTCYNTTVIHTGGGGGRPDTGDQTTGECDCPAGPRGARGPAGPPGPQGEPGLMGIQGKRGLIGLPGAAGIPGQPGPDGAQGPEGPRGRDGLRGSKGDPGDPGEQGPRGYPGRDGIPGPKGESASGGSGFPGERGPKGDPGRDGNNGRPGPRGPKGDPGIRGLSGARGPPGIPGQDGTPGLPGEKGDQGMIGLPGSDGIPGLDGYPGADGRPGPKGDAGIAGIPGLVGRKGDKGEVGEPGNINEVFESRLIKELLNTVENLQTVLERTTLEVRELKQTCNRLSACEMNCTVNTFKCACGKCIPNQYRCDGFPHCPDGTDENPTECQYICNERQFKCVSSGLCIPLDKKCNGIPDCADASDEGITCSSGSCLEGAFPCRDGSKCVAREERCDRKDDCLDGSDEFGCDCDVGQFQCVKTGECIAIGLLCDSFPDCGDESDEDEARCDKNQITCVEGQMPCNDLSACINRDSFCNGIQDCFDGSDEANCPGTLPDKEEDGKTRTGNAESFRTPSTSPATVATTTTGRPITAATTATTTTMAAVTSAPTSAAVKTTKTTEDDGLTEEGSGDSNASQQGLSCRELYDAWVDPEFPGGKPPPLSPNEEINEALCDYLRQQAGKLPRMSTRRKRYRNSDKISDDEEKGEMMQRDGQALFDGEDVDSDDLAFDDSDVDQSEKKTLVIEFNKDAIAASAIRGTDGSSGSPVVVASFSILTVGLAFVFYLRM